MASAPGPWQHWHMDAPAPGPFSLQPAGDLHWDFCFSIAAARKCGLILALQPFGARPSSACIRSTARAHMRMSVSALSRQAAQRPVRGARGTLLHERCRALLTLLSKACCGMQVVGIEIQEASMLNGATSLQRLHLWHLDRPGSPPGRLGAHLLHQLQF